VSRYREAIKWGHVRTRPAVAFPSKCPSNGANPLFESEVPFLCYNNFSISSSFQLCIYAGHIGLINTAKMSGSEQIHDLTEETQDSQAILESWRSKLVRIDTCGCTVASGVRVPKIAREEADKARGYGQGIGYAAVLTVSCS
jgi:hypothetical protein